ncbi:hypothetical protein [Luedemannella helvata]|uniref:hypothetical protein n=1 Tax=Luedemannella helvata TaxID=349315 RepID=UPI0031D87732
MTTHPQDPTDPGDPVDPYDSSAGPHPATYPDIYQPPPDNLPATFIDSQPWDTTPRTPTNPPAAPPAVVYPPPYPSSPAYPASPGYPPTAGYGIPPGGYPMLQPIIVVPPPPNAPYGVDPSTGQPLSDKSKVAAGLLQLLPGIVLCLGGIGRLYAGHVGLGVVQLLGTVIAWFGLVCGFFTIVGWCLTVPFWIWFVVDGIMLLAGRPTDSQGRLLRN